MHGRIHLLAALALALTQLPFSNSASAREPFPVQIRAIADLNDVYFLDADRAWAVGDRGVVLHSSDGGATWQEQTSYVGDTLNSVHFVDNLNGWVVGGSPVPHTNRGRGVVLRTDNGGRTWIVERNRSLPVLRHVQFFDRKHGIAVGDASSLYAAGGFTTHDGGRTWTPIPTRTANGWISADFRADGAGILLTKDGNITTYDGKNCRARTTPSRKRSGTMRSVAWIDDGRAIAVGDRGTVWRSGNAGATWQDISQPASEDTPDFHYVCSNGTDVWIVASPGNRVLHSADSCRTLRPISLPVPSTALDVVPTSGCICAVGPFGQIAMASDDLWRIVRNADQTRSEDRNPIKPIKPIEPNAQQRALVKQLIRRAVADPQRGNAWLAQIENLSNRLSTTSAAELLYDYSQKQFASGDSAGAIRTLESIVARYAESDFTDAALRKAVLWLSSREVAHHRRNRPSNITDNDDSDHEEKSNDVAAVTYEEPVRRGTQIPLDRLIKSGPTLADQMRTQGNPTDSTSAFERSDPQQWINRMGPETVADPDVQLAIESYRRRIRKPGVRQAAVYQRMSRTLPGLWRDCAAAELALLQPERDSRKSLLAGRFGGRPHLDGLLDTSDKATWPDVTTSGPDQHPAIVVPLGSTVVDANTPSGLVVMAGDSQFLYIAVHCQKQRGADYIPDLSPRARDADLSAHDRVDILIDTDRDYSLAWRLTVDHRGWTGESLGSDTSWNPQWYVAAKQQTTEWTCEAAIAWSELADAPPTAESPWGLTLVRTLADGKQHHWPLQTNTQPQRLENAGLFHFQ